MIVLSVFVKDLPDGMIVDADQVAPFQIAPGFSLTTQGVDPEQPYECVLLQRFVLEDMFCVPASLPMAIPNGARMKVTFEKSEMSAARSNIRFKAESDSYEIGNYQEMLAFATWHYFT